MGPRLHIAGHSYFKLPWSLLHRAPLIDQALPLRFTVYLFLMLAVLTARWMTEPRRATRTRATAGAIVLASLLPNPSAYTWAPPGAVAPPPTFFTNGTYRRYLAPGEIVATLPYARGETDQSMMWQALGGMHFRLAGGYPALSPLSFLRWPIVRSANQLATIPDPADQWKAFAANHAVTSVLIGEIPMPPGFPSIDPIVATLGSPVWTGGGVTLYRVAPATPYRSLAWTQMEALADAQRFDALLIAAQRYLASDADPLGLSPLTAAKLKFLPAAWLTTQSRGSDYRLYMRAESAGLITVGLMGTREGLRPLVDRYRVYARQIQFGSQRRIEERSRSVEGTYYYPLKMSFDRQGLERATASALTDPIRLDLGSKLP
jgi:hypothetical protein